MPNPTQGRRATETPAEPSSDLRMRDLTQRTGLPRETIHFYLAQGLLPKPRKTGRNTAVYGPEHLERLERIKELQGRHFLPLRAIKAVLENGSAEGFTEQQQNVIERIRSSLEPASAPGSVALSNIVPARVSRADVEAMRRLGVIDVEGKGAAARVSSEDAGILECWAEVSSLMRPGEPQLTPDMLLLYVDTMRALVDGETAELSQRMSRLPGARLVELIEASKPPISRLLALLRNRQIAEVIRGGARPPR